MPDGSTALAVVYLLIAPAAAGAVIGWAWDATSQVLHLRRTGHVRDCPGLRGWDCHCTEEP